MIVFMYTLLVLTAAPTLIGDNLLNIFLQLHLLGLRAPRRRRSAPACPSSLLPGRGDWIPEASALSRGMPALRLPRLPADERERLEEACRRAMSQLGRSA